MSTYPIGYSSNMVTMARLRGVHEPKMHPEFARRLFAWLESMEGLIGIGGGFRVTQPDRPGFAPDGKSFHQAQRFASGFVGYCAVDLVKRTGGVHSAPAWADSATAPAFNLHTFIKGEPWHIQPVEIRGWQTWVDAGRPDPVAPAPVPDPTPPPEGHPTVYLITPPPERPDGRWLVVDRGTVRLATSHDVTDKLTRRPLTDIYRVQQYDELLAVASNRPVPA